VSGCFFLNTVYNDWNSLRFTKRKMIDGRARVDTIANLQSAVLQNLQRYYIMTVTDRTHIA